MALLALSSIRAFSDVPVRRSALAENRAYYLLHAGTAQAERAHQLANNLLGEIFPRCANRSGSPARVAAGGRGDSISTAENREVVSLRSGGDPSVFIPIEIG